MYLKSGKCTKEHTHHALLRWLLHKGYKMEEVGMKIQQPITSATLSCAEPFAIVAHECITEVFMDAFTYTSIPVEEIVNAIQLASPECNAPYAIDMEEAILLWIDEVSRVFDIITRNVGSMFSFLKLCYL